jgi:hypothetical protein
MPFTLHVVFTGLCAFAPNRARNRMWVVLPDGRSKIHFPRISADGVKLRRHFGYVQFKAYQLASLDPDKPQPPQDMDAIWLLNRQRLTFNCTPAEASTPFSYTGLPNAANLEEMVPGYGNIDPSVVNDVPPPIVLSQVVLDRGVLLPPDPQKCSERILPPVLHREAIRKSLCSEIVWEVQGLSQVDIVATPFDGSGTYGRWSLAGSDGGIVTITVANLCDENLLRFETTYDELPDDEDFRWIYTLLKADDQTQLLRSLNGLHYPVPLTPAQEANGQGLNCSPVVFNPLNS